MSAPARPLPRRNQSLKEQVKPGFKTYQPRGLSQIQNNPEIVEKCPLRQTNPKTFFEFILFLF